MDWAQLIADNFDTIVGVVTGALIVFIRDLFSDMVRWRRERENKWQEDIRERLDQLEENIRSVSYGSVEVLYTGSGQIDLRGGSLFDLLSSDRSFDDEINQLYQELMREYVIVLDMIEGDRALSRSEKEATIGKLFEIFTRIRRRIHQLRKETYKPPSPFQRLVNWLRSKGRRNKNSP